MIDAAVVTGAGRGIGRAIALRLAADGAFVLCVSRTRAQDTADAIVANGGRAEALTLDLADYRNAESTVAAWIAGRDFTHLGVVLAAAIAGPKGPLLEGDLDGWSASFAVNVMGNLAVVRALLPSMIARRFGRILLFSGGGSAYAFPLFPAYAASKTAVVRACENLHFDLADKGDFAVVCVAPGAIDTDMLKTIRAAGAEVRTVADIQEPVAFAASFLNADSCGFSGCFVHVRDDWRPYLNSAETLGRDDMWKLRRVER